ncbi:hypothetical protein SAMN05216464_10956 [Mucilaginibacter pineti]|uniref:Uncharacterized protein n=1 Tax=Mucilaginibacter pineti TaxID=1391627 RepID=A0A1G7FH66_9SPHI|nr:hypothetical protein [Mucilaginibacter pineti]SDE75192.1 hypothetical protein SAMN05216464_10956 [Mucilaginibacter pineti]
MDNSREFTIYKAAQIAKTLFWINLAPAVVAGATFVYLFFDMLLNADYETTGFLILLIIGIAAEFTYYRQFTDADYTPKKIGWIYSIVINGLCVAAYLAAFVSNPSSLFLIAIYPIIFLTQSCRGLRMVSKIKRVPQVHP